MKHVQKMMLVPEPLLKTGCPFYFRKRGASFKSTCVVHSETIIPLTVGETGRYLPLLL